MQVLVIIGISLIVVGIFEIAVVQAVNTASCLCTTENPKCTCVIPLALIAVLYIGIGKVAIGIFLICFNFVRIRKERSYFKS